MVDKASASENVVAATGNDFLDTLIIGHKWNDDHAVTFYFDDGSQPEDVWLDAAKDSVRNALSTYENYIALEFEEVDNQADANFILRMNSLEEIGATARFGYPDESDDQAVGQFPYDWSRWTDWHLQIGGYAHETVLHELGHGLGLVHPFESDGLNGQPFPGVTDGDSSDYGTDGQNNAIYTVMSYLDHSQFWAPMPATSDLGWGYIASPMGLDIAALQHIYGANPVNNPGNSTYTLPTVNDDGTYWLAIWDTGGTDIIRHTGSADATIDLRAAPLVGPNAGGYLSRVDGIAGGFTIASGVTIEFAEGGSGDDTIIGNNANNEIAGRGGNDVILGLGGADLLDGGAGNDFIDGGTGSDVMIGGTGNDTFAVDSGSDVLHEGAGGGIDTVISTVTFTLGVHLENLQLAESDIIGIDGYGNALDNQIIGNSDGNVLEGRAGDDFINGGAGDDSIDGGTGEDTLLGGTGNDVLDGGADDGVFTLAAAAALDRISNVLTARPDPDGGIDDIRATQLALPISSGNDDELHGGNDDDTLIGRGGDDALFGDAGNDLLLGGSGADWLDGGTGNDTMIGNGQNDIYVVDSELDSVFEAANEGIDGVFSAINYALGANVENLALIGGATNHISGTGNGLDNWIIGNAGSNIIDGLGGDDFLLGLGGNDFIDGGTGEDQIFGGDGNDVLDGGDDDVIISSGVAALAFGFGFGFADTLFGGAGNDILYGRGGNDALHGGLGNDELYGEGGNDTAHGDEGDDIVDGGAGADYLYGEAGDDFLVGGGGGDRLNGGIGNDVLDGGTGSDTMVGGGGNDLFFVDSVGDKVLEGLALGEDGVVSSVSYTLGPNVENLLLVNSPTPDIDGTGNTLDNLIIGNDDGNAIDGRAGNDVLAGLGGDDSIDGGHGNDLLDGGAGSDVLDGGIGDDELQGGEGDDALDGGLGNDLLVGGDGEDLLIGDLGNDELAGGADDDSLDGGLGNDLLSGEEGDDVLIGGLGSDTIDGGTGDDTMTGGLHADTFVFGPGSGADTITDFKVNQDLIDVTALFSDFSEVEAVMSQNGPNTEIAFNMGSGDVLTLVHVPMALLDANDFVI